MTQTYSVSTGTGKITVAEEYQATRITVEDEDGSAEIVLTADKMRGLMGSLGLFCEPYAGAWSKLNPNADSTG